MVGFVKACFCSRRGEGHEKPLDPQWHLNLGDSALVRDRLIHHPLLLQCHGTATLLNIKLGAQTSPEKAYLPKIIHPLMTKHKRTFDYFKSEAKYKVSLLLCLKNSENKYFNNSMTINM